MSKLGHYLTGVFFPVLSPLRLAVARVATGGYAFYFLWGSSASLVKSAGGAREIFSPVGAAAFLTEPLHPDTYRMFVLAAQILCVPFATGFLYRVTAPIFAALFLFVMSYSNSWAMVFHTENMLVLHVVVLAIAPAAATFSLDAMEEKASAKGWLTRALDLLKAKADTTPHWVYGWSLVMMQLVATLPYVVAGLAKVLGKSGIAWALGHSLRDQITMNGIYYEMLMGGTEEITFHVYGYEHAFLVAATMTLVLELGAPLAILHRYIGYAYVVGIMSMHWSILILMGIPFRYQMYGFAFACFLPWERLPSLLGGLQGLIQLHLASSEIAAKPPSK